MLVYEVHEVMLISESRVDKSWLCMKQLHLRTLQRVLFPFHFYFSMARGSYGHSPYKEHYRSQDKGQQYQFLFWDYTNRLEESKTWVSFFMLRGVASM